MNAPSSSIRTELLARCRALGAVAAGVAAAEPVDSDALAHYALWLQRGYNATMDYAARYDDVRRDPRLLLPGAQSVVCMAFSYFAPGEPRSPLFADYALGEDYHKALRRRLKPLARWMETEAVPGSRTRICVDTAPLRERYFAVLAGLGFIGRNHQLITPVGSAVFLAEILWTAPVEPSEPDTRSCLSCGACLRACPTGALRPDGSFDARRCLSYLTIEHRGPLPDGTALPARIYGCDICRDVCPHNRAAASPPEVIPPFEPRPQVLELTLPRVASMDSDTFNEIFSGSAVRRAGLDGLRRNAHRALSGSSSDPAVDAPPVPPQQKNPLFEKKF